MSLTAATETAPLLLREDAVGITTLTLNRSSAYNSLSTPLMDALQTELARIAEDRQVRVVLLKGRGKAFCSGHDLKEIHGERTEAAIRAIFERCSKLMLSLAALPQPVVAVVDGIATAAGCQLVAACDLAIASDKARFATSGVKYGLFCSTPMVALARVVPAKAALEMLFTGDFIDAHEAHRLGLLNQVVHEALLDDAVRMLCARLTDKPFDTLALGKAAYYRQREMTMRDAYAFTTDVIVNNALDANTAEGLSAFVEKRAPVWPEGGA